MLERLVAVIGPPVVGKTTLTRHLGRRAGYHVFCLPESLLWQPARAAIEPYECIDDFTIIAALHASIESVSADPHISTLLLDGLPETGTQLSLLCGLLRQLAPACVVTVVELLADPEVLARRGRGLRDYQARRSRYDDLRVGMRDAFTTAGIVVTWLDMSCLLEEAVGILVDLMESGKVATDV